MKVTQLQDPSGLLLKPCTRGSIRTRDGMVVMEEKKSLVDGNN